MGYSFAYGVFCLGLYVAAPFSRKIRKGIQGRRGLTARLLKARALWKQSPIWFHVASSGELEQAMPIMEAVRRQAPQLPLFLSYFSPSGKRAVELETERRRVFGKPLPWDYADYSPYDFRFSVRRALDALGPTHYVTINRELWPGLLEECFARQIPCYLFASYFAEPARRWLPLYRRWLKHFRHIGTIEEDTSRFLREALPDSPVVTAGDPRVERVLLRRRAQRPQPWVPFFENQKVLIFASIWKQDFRALQPTLEAIARQNGDWRLLLAPHEPQERFVREIVADLKSRGLSVRRWKHWLEAPDLHSHLVIDQVGPLAELYSIASLVFVGGSFRARVHNVLEPAAYGRPVFTGPFIENSAEALEMWRQKAGLIRVENGQDLYGALSPLLGDAREREASGQRLEAFLNARQGAGDRYARLLLP